MFKTLTFLCLCLLLAYSTHLSAQVRFVINEKLLSGSLGFVSGTHERLIPEQRFDTFFFPSYLSKRRSQAFKFSFQSARMLSARFALGVGLSGSIYHEKKIQIDIKNTYESKGSRVTLTPYYFMQYFRPVNNRFYWSAKFQTQFILEAESGFFSPSSFFQSNSRLKVETITANLRLVPAFAYLLHPRVLLELELAQFNFYRNVKTNKSFFDFDAQPTWSNLRVWFRFDNKTPPQ